MTKSQHFIRRLLLTLLCKSYEHEVSTSYRRSAPWGVS